jgi:ankyrin repeat protein
VDSNIFYTQAIKELQEDSLEDLDEDSIVAIYSDYKHFLATEKKVQSYKNIFKAAKKSGLDGFRQLAGLSSDQIDKILENPHYLTLINSGIMSFSDMKYDLDKDEIGQLLKVKPIRGAKLIHYAIDDYISSLAAKIIEDDFANLEVCDDKYHSPPLLWAANRGNYQAIKMIAESNHAVNLDAQDGGGKNDRSALMYVCSSQSRRAVGYLIGRNVNLDLQDTHGDTALIRSCRKKDLGVAEMLIRAGANYSIRNKNGLSASDIMKDRKFDQLIERYNSHARNPLMMAVEKDDFVAVNRLLAKGTYDINAVDRRGDSALHIAAIRSNKEMYDLLVENGADSSKKNNIKHTPKDIIDKMAILSWREVVSRISSANANHKRGTDDNSSRQTSSSGFSTSSSSVVDSHISSSSKFPKTPRRGYVSSLNIERRDREEREKSDDVIIAID